MQEQQLPSVVEASGRAAAQLSDWQTVTYFLMVIIVMLIAERVYYATMIRKERRDMAGERERMWSVSDKFGDAAKTLGENTNKVVTELEVQRALNARMEHVITDAEEALKELRRR